MFFFLACCFFAGGAGLFLADSRRPAVLPDFSGEWRSLAAHLVWDQRVAGSNPVSPTIFEQNPPEFDICQTKA